MIIHPLPQAPKLAIWEIFEFENLEGERYPVRVIRGDTPGSWFLPTYDLYKVGQ